MSLPMSWSDGTVRGVLHVHSRTSDGRGTLDDIAAAAAASGLQFVVVTDHGDGTRPPEPPSYRTGVLVLDAVEISTRSGHYVALGLPQSPYALGGEAADVVEDVRRMGGFGIAAHPDSPKDDLRWSDWSAPIDALEIINPDTSWRVHASTGGLASKWLLLRALLADPVRPAESIAELLTGRSRLTEQWMTLAAHRPIVALAGADAHAKLAFRDTEPGDNRYSIPIPTYQSSFESLSVHVRTDRTLSGDAAADAETLLRGIRGGSVYVAIDGWASPAAFEFTATSGATTVSEGSALESGSPVTLHVRSNAPSGYQTTVWNGTERLAQRTEPAFDLPVGVEPGVYRVEVERASPPAGPPWITSNPIYVRHPVPDPVPDRREVPAPVVRIVAGQSLFDGRTTSGWSYESDHTSLSVVDVADLVDGARVRLRYGLSGGSAVGQYAAAAVAVPSGVEAADAVAFTVRAEAPMRIS